MDDVEAQGPRACVLRLSPWVHARAAVSALLAAIVCGAAAVAVASPVLRIALAAVTGVLLLRVGRSLRRVVRRPPDFLLDRRGVTHVVSGRAGVPIPWGAIRSLEPRPRGPWWPTAGGRCVTVRLDDGGEVHLPADIEGLAPDALEPILAAWTTLAARRSETPS